MKVIVNKLIPFKGFKAINLFGVLFVRAGSRLSDNDYQHEYIHTLQMKELPYIFFYLMYAFEFIIRLIQYRKWHLAYRRISFEREAYTHQYNEQYLKTRKPFAFINYL